MNIQQIEGSHRAIYVAELATEEGFRVMPLRVSDRLRDMISIRRCRRQLSRTPLELRDDLRGDDLLGRVVADDVMHLNERIPLRLARVLHDFQAKEWRRAQIHALMTGGHELAQLLRLPPGPLSGRSSPRADVPPADDLNRPRQPLPLNRAPQHVVAIDDPLKCGDQILETVARR